MITKKSLLKNLKQNLKMCKELERTHRKLATNNSSPEDWDTSRVFAGYVGAYQEFIQLLKDSK